MARRNNEKADRLAQGVAWKLNQDGVERTPRQVMAFATSEVKKQYRQATQSDVIWYLDKMAKDSEHYALARDSISKQVKV